MAGSLKLDGNEFLVKEGGQFKITNSELKLKSSGNTVVDSSGNAVISESGGTVAVTNSTLGSSVIFPSGCIIQILQSVKTDTQQVGNSSTSYTAAEELTGMSVTITPKITPSKFLITCSIHVGADGGQEGIHFRLFKNGSVITGAQGATSNSGTNKDRNFMHIGSHGTNEIQMGSGLYLDSNTGTSAITYSIRARAYSTSNSGYINRAMVEQADDTRYSRPISTMTVQEIVP
jgi:hypothetical protein